MEVLLDTWSRRGVTFLLPLILLVVKAAADCPKPQAEGNTVLSDRSLLLNTFQEGVEVYFECANGYVVESGSGRITCLQNNWSAPDLACRKKDCGPPKAKPNMSYDLSAGTLFGAVIRVLCDEGFEISGSSHKQCYAKGWSGSARCIIISCDPPAEVTNGRSSWGSQDSPRYGEVVHYVCNQGYTLIGSSSITCSTYGEYDSPAPTCEGVATEERPTTAMVSPTSTPPQGVATEERIKTAILSTTSTPPQEVSPSTESSASLTTRRDKTTSAIRTASPSERGGRGVLTAVTPTTSPSLQGDLGGAVDTNRDLGHAPVVISVVCVSLVVCILAFCLHKFLLKRKGSANGAVGTY